MTRDWIAAAAGPIAWFSALVASWMLAPAAHEAGSLGPLYAIDAAALVVAVAAGAVAMGRVRRLRRLPPGDRRVQRDHFVAVSAVALSALSIVLVIGLALPNFLLLPGAEP
jgi:hypothetical protein